MSYEIPDAPLDFLNRPMAVDDWITYPTGGQSCRMVLARIVSIKDERDQIYSVVRQDRYGSDYIYWQHKQGHHNGYIGPAAFILTVQRYQDGTRKAGDTKGYWKVDSGRKIRIEQLHRVIKLEPDDIPEFAQLLALEQ